MKAVGILLVAFVASCCAANPPGLDLDAIEKELKNAPLVAVDIRLQRFSFGALFRKACKCEGVNCGCCASPKIFDAIIKGCINFNLVPAKKQLGVELKAMEKTVLNRQFSTVRAERICGTLPGRASFLGYCFNTEITGNEAAGIQACSMFEVKVKTTTALNVRFRCVRLEGSKISFIENVNEGNGVIDVKAKDPFKKVIQWFKKK